MTNPADGSLVANVPQLGVPETRTAIEAANAAYEARLEELGEEILQAMRETAAPTGYEEQVREYYRRLVE